MAGLGGGRDRGGRGLVVIDPLEDPGATFAALGDGARDVQLPPVVAAEARRTAVAGMVSHLHRDHADSGALAAAMAPGATVHEPAWPGGDGAENLALAQANAELERSGLARRQVEQWERRDAGPFAITPLPAVDGLGDPQVSWLVEAGGRRVLHLGDTIFHGYWWRMARRHGPFDLVFVPINGAVIDFPHLQPPSVLAAAMEPEQAALAGDLWGRGPSCRCTTTATGSTRGTARSTTRRAGSGQQQRAAPMRPAC